MQVQNGCSLVKDLPSASFTQLRVDLGQAHSFALSPFRDQLSSVLFLCSSLTCMRLMVKAGLLLKIHTPDWRNARAQEASSPLLRTQP